MLEAPAESANQIPCTKFPLELLEPEIVIPVEIVCSFIVWVALMNPGELYVNVSVPSVPEVNLRFVNWATPELLVVAVAPDKTPEPEVTAAVTTTPLEEKLPLALFFN
jgi:hypothetical protein